MATEGPRDGTRPAGSTATAPAGAATTAGGGAAAPARRRPAPPPTPIWKYLAAALVGLIVGAGATALVTSRGDDGLAGRIASDRAQAVILANDKVYFGQVRDAGPEFLELRNAFFLRETPATGGGEPTRTLVPLRQEIHSPENRMLIRRDQVVLVENLAPDSPVQQEIARQTGR